MSVSNISKGEIIVILKGGLILLVYVLLKGGYTFINESEEIKFSVPKLVQRLSFGLVACLTQVMFF